MRSRYFFGDALVQARRERGFSSAHGFFKVVRGRRTLGLAYANYVNWEKGRSLPRPARLRRILSALELQDNSLEARTLVRAYMTSLLGSDDLLALLGAGDSLSPDPFEWQSAEDVARQALSPKIVYLNTEQNRLLIERPNCWRCHIFLSNTEGWLESATLSRATGLSLAEARSAAKELVRAGLAAISKDKVRSRLTARVVQVPMSLDPEARLRDSLRRNRELKREEKPTTMYSMAVRLTRSQLQRFSRHYRDAVRLSGIYADAQKTSDSAVYLVEGCVYRLFD